MISKELASQRIEKLKKTVNYHRYLYHVLDRQEISDAALDSLKNELVELEKKFPEFITPDSPTQRVGGVPLNKFKKIKHKVRQWSFDDAFSEKEMIDFDAKIKRFLLKRTDLEDGPRGRSLEYVCELKIDGFKIILDYEKGILKTAATRGDGIIGEDVTQNVKTIESIPLRLQKEIDVIVEGEIWMSKSEFEKINNERKKNNESLFANPRNIAAGSIRQLDPKIAASRNLDSFIYDISYLKSQISNLKSMSKTQLEELKLLSELGFKVNKNFKLCKNIGEVIDFWKFWQKKRDKMEYWIDGIAVKLNDRYFQESLGYTGKSPRFAIALKFPAEQATTIVEDIIIQVGRTGVLTPVAILRPVSIAGSIVSRATLHNKDEVEKLDVRIGDTVILQKAGDIIPDIVSVLKEMRTGKEKKFKMPLRCPICDGELSFEKNSPLIKCKNTKCAVRHRRSLYYFASKHGFNMEGLGPKIIDALLDNGLIQDAADLFDLKEGDISPLERFGEKSAENLIKAINGRREIDFVKFITSLGIPNVGEETAEDLAVKFGSIDDLRGAETEELESIGNIGPIVARSIYNWFNDRYNNIFLEKLLSRVKIKKIKKQFGTKLKGNVFVFTGTMSMMSRDIAKEKVKALGGDVSESISAKTDFLIAGGEAGSKLERAKKLGVKIINEKEFLNMLK